LRPTKRNPRPRFRRMLRKRAEKNTSRMGERDLSGETFREGVASECLNLEEKPLNSKGGGGTNLLGRILCRIRKEKGKKNCVLITRSLTTKKSQKEDRGTDKQQKN